MKKQFLIWFLLMLTAAALSATPSDGLWVRQDLLGVNDKEVFLLEYRFIQPGSYYKYTEETWLVRSDLKSHQEVSRTLVRRVHWVDQTTEGQWTIKDQENHPLDLVQLMQEQGLHPVFPRTFAGSEVALVDGDIVYRHLEYQAPILSGHASLKGIAPEDAPILMRVLEPAVPQHQASGPVFFEIQAGSSDMDMDQSTWYLWVSQKEMVKAWNDLLAQAKPPQAK